MSELHWPYAARTSFSSTGSKILVVTGFGIGVRISVFGPPGLVGDRPDGGKNLMPHNFLRSFGAGFDVQVGLAGRNSIS